MINESAKVTLARARGADDLERVVCSNTGTYKSAHVIRKHITDKLEHHAYETTESKLHVYYKAYAYIFSVIAD